jgi:ribosomal protein S18 acetylase RimI-like enzyme
VAEEIDDLAELHVRCWREAYAGLHAPDFLADLSTGYRADIWRKVIADPGMFALVAWDGNERAGFVIAGPASPDYRRLADSEIHALYVLGAFQGRGIGRRLLEAGLADRRRQGDTNAVAMVFSGNLRARGFYEAMGGRAVGEAGLELGGQSLVEIAYSFALATVPQ